MFESTVPTMKDIGRTHNGNHVVEISSELVQNLVSVAYALIGAFDRPSSDDDIDRWDEAVQALDTLLKVIVQEIGIAGERTTMPKVVVTKTISVEKRSE